MITLAIYHTPKDDKLKRRSLRFIKKVPNTGIYSDKPIECLIHFGDNSGWGERTPMYNYRFTLLKEVI